MLRLRWPVAVHGVGRSGATHTQVPSQTGRESVSPAWACVDSTVLCGVWAHVPCVVCVRIYTVWSVRRGVELT